MSEPAPVVDLQVEQMKAAKEGAAVLKMEIVTLRGKAPGTLIFAFEGDEDKGAYYQWIKAIDHELKYEPFPCSGKGNVLELRKVVLRDKNDLAGSVFFFVDRDFDDLRGQAPDPTVFMTDQYSVENYLVTAEVLVELLKNDFHCHGQPDIRAEVSRLFDAAYASFLKATRPLNFRLFVARKLKIDVLGKPTRISHIATVELDSAAAAERTLPEILILGREPTAEEEDQLRPDFETLDPVTRFRGKFALMFFLRWLAILAEQRREARGPLFDNLDAGVKIRLDVLSVELLASKAAPPPGLRDFIEGIRERQAA